MRSVLVLLLLVPPCATPQFGVPRINKPEHPQTELQTLPERRPPDEASLKADYAKSAAEVDEIVKLSHDLKAEMDKGDARALPVHAMQLLGEIEKHARQARRRLKH
ncbi:MAG: hypothetical protein K2X03_07305 [Bryobacteraceae bacterium]|nr:hypothetical protein [Bryobacteraceae bacterium]